MLDLRNETPLQPELDHDLREALLEPEISLFGCVDDQLFWSFKSQMEKALAVPGDIVLELSTTGGDAETARRIALELRLSQELRGRKLIFLGKSFIYSAGITIMSGFAKENRYLSRDCHLLIHSRRLDKHVHYTGPLSSNVQIAEEVLMELKSGLELEREGFQDLARGSNVSPEEVQRRAANNWYLRAPEAVKLGLVEGLL
jgi:ATP-dependent protease ClpP protease subunit